MHVCPVCNGTTMNPYDNGLAHCPECAKTGFISDRHMKKIKTAAAEIDALNRRVDRMDADEERRRSRSRG